MRIYFRRNHMQTRFALARALPTYTKRTMPPCFLHAMKLIVPQTTNLFLKIGSGLDYDTINYISAFIELRVIRGNFDKPGSKNQEKGDKMRTSFSVPTTLPSRGTASHELMNGHEAI